MAVVSSSLSSAPCGGGGGLVEEPCMITCFSAPRCLSTSLMYSFNARADVAHVIDEPLYAHYVTTSGAARPYKEQLLQEQDSDAVAVMKKMKDGTYSIRNNCTFNDIIMNSETSLGKRHDVQDSSGGGNERKEIGFPIKKKYVYVKHIAKLLTTSEQVMREAAELAGKCSFILIRDPRKVICQAWMPILTFQRNCFQLYVLQLFCVCIMDRFLKVGRKCYRRAWKKGPLYISDTIRIAMTKEG